MTSYIFSPDTALDTGGELAQATSELERSLSALDSSAKQFLATNESVTKDTYLLAQAKWNEGQRLINEALAKGKAALDEIHREYVLGDAKGANVMQGNL